MDEEERLRIKGGVGVRWSEISFCRFRARTFLISNGKYSRRNPFEITFKFTFRIEDKPFVPDVSQL